MNPYVNSSIQKMGMYLPPIEGRRSYSGCLLDFNERTVPASPFVGRALREMVNKKQFQIYPEYGDLTKKIAQYAGVNCEKVMITNGSDQGIDIIFRTYTQRNDNVIIPTPSFAMFDQCAGIIGNTVLRPTYRADLSFPLEELMEMLDQNSVKLVVLCNPNNPTGSYLDLKAIRRVLEKAILTNTVVYIDEAYYEFLGITAVPLLKEFSNLIITRTFSKAFGLAALRVGYVLSQEENINELMKVRGPYDVNMFGWAAAKAALEDVSSMELYVNEVMQKAKPLIENFFKKNGIAYFSSGANFILFRPKNSEQVFESLKSQGILVRPRKGPNIEKTLRVSIGTVSQMKKFIKSYPL